MLSVLVCTVQVGKGARARLRVCDSDGFRPLRVSNSKPRSLRTVLVPTMPPNVLTNAEGGTCQRSQLAHLGTPTYWLDAGGNPLNFRFFNSNSTKLHCKKKKLKSLQKFASKRQNIFLVSNNLKKKTRKAAEITFDGRQPADTKDHLRSPVIAF